MNGGGRKPLIPKHLIFWLIFSYVSGCYGEAIKTKQAAAHTSERMQQLIWGCESQLGLYYKLETLAISH